MGGRFHPPVPMAVQSWGFPEGHRMIAADPSVIGTLDPMGVESVTLPVPRPDMVDVPPLLLWTYPSLTEA